MPSDTDVLQHKVTLLGAGKDPWGKLLGRLTQAKKEESPNPAATSFSAVHLGQAVERGLKRSHSISSLSSLSSDDTDMDLKVHVVQRSTRDKRPKYDRNVCSLRRLAPVIFNAKGGSRTYTTELRPIRLEDTLRAVAFDVDVDSSSDVEMALA